MPAAAGTRRPPAFNTKAWLLWLLASLVAVNAIENPFAVPVMLGALAAVAGSFASAGPEARSFAALLKLGLAFLVIRVVLFALTGHTGETTLATLPVVELPRWLGGFSVGGRVTAEVLAQSALEGLRLAMFLACLGTFLAVTNVYRVLRLLPRFLAEAGLVVTIALAFVPTMFRSASEIRDAQRLRGHRFRGLRSVAPLALPVLASGLERSVTLAESMDVRGYGRRTEGAARAEAWARAGALAAMVAVAAGGALFLFGRGPAGMAAAILALGALGLAASLAALSRTVPRTRMRRERWGAWDWALSGGCVAVAAGTLVLRALAPEAATYYPYPRISWPPLHAGAAVVGAGLALPAALGVLRSARLARASVHPGASPPGGEGAPAGAPTVSHAIGARR